MASDRNLDWRCCDVFVDGEADYRERGPQDQRKWNPIQAKQIADKIILSAAAQEQVYVVVDDQLIEGRIQMHKLQGDRQAHEAVQPAEGTLAGLKPKKRLREPAKSDHWCIHCDCHIRAHALGVYDKELARYTITCQCGKCPGYARKEK